MVLLYITASEERLPFCDGDKVPTQNLYHTMSLWWRWPQLCECSEVNDTNIRGEECSRGCNHSYSVVCKDQGVAASTAQTQHRTLANETDGDTSTCVCLTFGGASSDPPESQETVTCLLISILLLSFCWSFSSSNIVLETEGKKKVMVHN